MTSKSPRTVAAYLAELPAPRREALAAVRDVILSHLPEGYEESIGFGMISYGVPLAAYPNTYNGQPLCYAALAAQKNSHSLYLMSVYAGDQLDALKRGFADAGLQLDMGKSCIRFKSAADLPLDTIGAVIASTPPKRWIEIFEESRATSAVGGGKKKAVGASAPKQGGAKKEPAARRATKTRAAQKPARKR